MLEKLIANKERIPLIKHSKAVSILSEFIFDKISDKTKFVDYDKIKSILINTALLHDIGKCTSQFQQYIADISTNIDYTKIIYHNEIGWAFLSSIYSNNKSDKLLLDSIYWHHAKKEHDNFYKNSSIKILEKISKTDLDIMIDFYNHILNVNIDYLDVNDFSENSIPVFFKTQPTLNDAFKNEYPILIRSILISSDQIISSLNIDEINIILSDKLNNKFDYCDNITTNQKHIITNIIKPESYNELRFNEQLNIVKNIDDNCIIQLNAPAGFGKTLLGTMWSLKSRKKLLWICPRNVVVESVYDSVLNELVALGIDNISIELYLHGE